MKNSWALRRSVNSGKDILRVWEWEVVLRQRGRELAKASDWTSRTYINLDIWDITNSFTPKFSSLVSPGETRH